MRFVFLLSTLLCLSRGYIDVVVNATPEVPAFQPDASGAPSFSPAPSGASPPEPGPGGASPTGGESSLPPIPLGGPGWMNMSFFSHQDPGMPPSVYLTQRILYGDSPRYTNPPKNISRVFTGMWILPGAHANYTGGFANATTTSVLRNATGFADGVSGFGFNTRSGPLNIKFDMRGDPTSGNETSVYTQGFLVYADGEGRTTPARKMTLEGIYHAGTGQFFGVAYPEDSRPTVHDFNYHRNFNGTDSFTMAAWIAKRLYSDAADVAGPEPRFGYPSDKDVDASSSSSSSTSTSSSTSSSPPRGVKTLPLCLFKMYARFNLEVRPNDPSGAGTLSSSSSSSSSSPGSRYKRVPDFSEVEGQLRSGAEEYVVEPGVVTMDAVILSPDCHAQVDVVGIVQDQAALMAKIESFSHMVLVVCLAQIYVLIKQMESLATPAGAAKASVVTFGAMALMDAYICLFHLSLGLVFPAIFNSLAFVALLKFVIFSGFEIRILLMVWKARNPGDESENVRYLFIFMRFYLALATGFFLVYWLKQYFSILILACFLIWVPQIIHSAVNNTKKPLQPQFIIVMSLSRLAIPLYFSLCPANFLDVSFSPAFAFPLIAIMGLEATLLLLQYYKGPRYFVPARFLPASYNYGRLPTRDLEEGGEGGSPGACVICMQDITSEEIEERKHMTTPCDHCFHAECLSEWMEVKLECPTCRAPIPPQ